MSVLLLLFFVQRAFLPTMPDDMLAIAQQAMGHLQWYCKYKPMDFKRPANFEIPALGFFSVTFHRQLHLLLLS